MNPFAEKESDILKDFYQRYEVEVLCAPDRGTRTKHFEVWMAEENKLLRDELTATKKQSGVGTANSNPHLRLELASSSNCGFCSGSDYGFCSELD